MGILIQYYEKQGCSYAGRRQRSGSPGRGQGRPALTMAKKHQKNKKNKKHYFLRNYFVHHEKSKNTFFKRVVRPDDPDEKYTFLE